MKKKVTDLKWQWMEKLWGKDSIKWTKVISDWTLDQRPLVETGKRKERKQRRLTIITLIILRERIKSFVVVVTGNGGDGGCGGGRRKRKKLWFAFQTLFGQIDPPPQYIIGHHIVFVAIFIRQGVFFFSRVLYIPDDGWRMDHPENVV